MVLISEDEYAQLQARTKPTEDVTESSVREHNNTEISAPSEKSTKPSEVSEKSTHKLKQQSPISPYKVNVIPKKYQKNSGGEKNIKNYVKNLQKFNQPNINLHNQG